MNHKRKLYLKLCDELDFIIDKSGVKKVCEDCFTKGLYKHAEAYDYITGKIVKKTYGCCKDCKHTDGKGCNAKSIACKLWLCSFKLAKMIAKAGYGDRWEEIAKIAVDNHWVIHTRSTYYRFVRMDINDYKELQEDK